MLIIGVFMINYIIGFGTAAIVILVIAKKIIKAKKGEDSGCCSGCSGCCNCPSSSACALKNE